MTLPLHNPALQDLLATELAERSLRAFVKQAWHVVEQREFLPGWHIDAICDHLEAVSRGEIRRLCINIPPRHGKSLLVGVFWSAWTWACQPEKSFIFSSYAQALSLRDSRKFRRLILSPWYRARWGDRVALSPLFANAQQRIENTNKGVRLATSVGATGTGEGGDIIAVDDPHKRGEVDSRTKREKVLEWWDEEMSTRANGKDGAWVIVMQRLHHQDLSGHVLSGGQYEHLCLPAEYEPTTRVTGIGFEDPRTEPGELLWPNRFDREGLDDLKASFRSARAVAGQLQQRPTPREGNVIKESQVLRWGGHHPLPPESEWALCVQSWDMSHGSKADTASYTVGQVWVLSGSRFYLVDQIRGRWGLPGMMARVKEMTTRWPQTRAVLVEDKAHGKAILQTLVGEIPGLIAIEPTGDKMARLEAVAHLFERGRVFVPDAAPWVDTPDGFVWELTKFPGAAFDDQADATSQALQWLRSAADPE